MFRTPRLRRRIISVVVRDRDLDVIDLTESDLVAGTQETIAATSVFFMPLLMQQLINAYRTTSALSVLGCISFVGFILALSVLPIEVEEEERNAAKEEAKDPEEAIEFGPVSLFRNHVNPPS